MEPDAPPPPPSSASTELRALARLRDRIETAAREIERLRSENAALARRVLELQDARHDTGPSFSLGDESPDELRARIQGFIATIDEVLASSASPTDATGHTNGAASDA